MIPNCQRYNDTHEEKVVCRLVRIREESKEEKKKN